MKPLDGIVRLPRNYSLIGETLDWRHRFSCGIAVLAHLGLPTNGGRQGPVEAGRRDFCAEKAGSLNLPRNSIQKRISISITTHFIRTERLFSKGTFYSNIE